MSYILLKYFQNEQYMKEFQAGHLYINSLGLFWNEGPLREAAKERAVIASQHPDWNPEDITVPIEWGLSMGQY